MIHEAIDTAAHIFWALFAWIVVLAALATPVVLGIAAGITWAVKRAWRRVARPSWARGRLRARILARRRLRRPHSPSDDHDYQEAA
ncbi:hypothetical protein ACQEVY_23355 [Streptomyces sp. CA-288835]|uniref:hypothetical protein n=1 Tax=Streptomyces sp. CA-288835 TaxID=3240069 RepID=UPI003D8FA444